MNNKISSLLGFCSKAGRMSYGMNTAIEALKSGVSRLTISAADTSDKSKKELIFHSEKYGVQCFILDITAEELSHAVGRRCNVLSVNDTGFADAIKKIGQ